MSKSTYQNIVIIPGSSSDLISDGSTIGGDIVANFKAIADIVSKSSTSTDSGVIVGYDAGTASGSQAIVAGGNNNSSSSNYCAVLGGSSNTSSGSYSCILGGRGNNCYGSSCGSIGTGYSYVYGSYNVAAGAYNVTLNGSYSLGTGYNLTSNVSGALVTNYDYNGVNVGGFSFVKSLTSPAGYSYETNANMVCTIPSGGMGFFELHILNPDLLVIEKVTLKIFPDSSGYLTPQESYSSSQLSFYYTSNCLYIPNSGSTPVQIGVFGTIIGEAGAYGSDSSGSDYYYGS